MTDYKSLNQKSIWIMRINAIIIAITTTGILYVVRKIIRNIEALDIVYLNIMDTIIILIIFQLVLNIILFPKIRFRRWKYDINTDRIDIVTGLITIKREIIPIIRIQKIEMTSGPIDRRFKLANIKIVTAAGEAQIKFLTVEEAEKISYELEKLLKNKLREQPSIKEYEMNE